jgi:hypothetical protein
MPLYETELLMYYFIFTIYEPILLMYGTKE